MDGRSAMWALVLAAAACGPASEGGDAEATGADGSEDDDDSGGAGEGDGLVGDDDEPCTPSATRELLVADDPILSAVVIDDALLVAVDGSIVRIEQDGATAELVADAEVHSAGLAVTDDAIVWHVHGDPVDDNHPPSVMWRAPRGGGAPTLVRAGMPSIDDILGVGGDLWWVTYPAFLEPAQVYRWRAGASEPDLVDETGGVARRLGVADGLVVATFGAWDPPSTGWATAWDLEGTPIELAETEASENSLVEAVALGTERLFASHSTNVRLEAVSREGGATQLLFELALEPYVCDVAGRLVQLETVGDAPWWLLEDGKILRESAGTIEVVHAHVAGDWYARWFAVSGTTLFVVEQRASESEPELGDGEMDGRVIAIDLE